tara:strand:+ start:523 stop:777 length:255 start_codon:yes stop_codon:yes gene_type:complete
LGKNGLEFGEEGVGFGQKRARLGKNGLGFGQKRARYNRNEYNLTYGQIRGLVKALLESMDIAPFYLNRPFYHHFVTILPPSALN